MLVDSHCHLDFPDFAEELDDVVARAENAGVRRMVTICTRVRKFEQIHAVAQRFENVYCSVGTHPLNTGEELDITTQMIVDHAQNEKVVAIGEAGLDYFYDKDPREQQQQVFRTNIAAARETGLPLVIHARAADDDMIAILQDEMKKGVFCAILHCFSSTQKLANVGVELGFYVSFSGILTFKNSQEIRDIASTVPHERLLVETDAPYLAPPPFRGKRNEPSYTVHTAKVLAETLGKSEEEVWQQTSQNFFTLFSKMPKPTAEEFLKPPHLEV
jgi:TatD DNase family protein